MVGTRADDAHLDAVLFIPSCEAVDDIDAVARVEVVNGTLAVDSPDLTLLLAKKKEYQMSTWYGSEGGGSALHAT